MSTDSQSQ